MSTRTPEVKRVDTWYVVWVGYEPGIYESWSEAQDQVVGYPGAKFRKFRRLQDAQEAFHRGEPDY